MATTPNYGFIMPDPTDFVTDLPADFEIFGDEVDLRIKALNPETTEGDLAYRGATADGKDRLAIGTAGQVLAVNSGATAPEWVTPAVSPITTEGDLIIGDATGDSVRLPIGAAGTYLKSDGDTASWDTVSAGGWTLINTGGTALTGATAITVSSINDYDNLFILITDASSVSATAIFEFKFNATGNGHVSRGQRNEYTSSYSAANFNELVQGAIPAGGSSIEWARMATSFGASNSSGFIMVHGATQAGVKILQHVAGTDPSGGHSHKGNIGGGYYTDTDPISSFTLTSSFGNFDAGTIFVYGR